MKTCIFSSKMSFKNLKFHKYYLKEKSSPDYLLQSLLKGWYLIVINKILKYIL